LAFAAWRQPVSQYFGAPLALHEAFPPAALQEDFPLPAGAALPLHEAFPPAADGSAGAG